MKRKTAEWRMNSLTSGYLKRVVQSKQIVQQCKDSGIRYSISWSGGKDSTVLVHLVKSIWPDVPIVVQTDNCALPEKHWYISDICERFGWSVEYAYATHDVYGFIKNNLSIAGLTHTSNKESFLKPLDDAAKRLKCGGTFLGLRDDESRGRTMNTRMRGHTYQKADGRHISNPLYRWRVEDIFSYHVANQIPINPYYWKNKYFTPEQLRFGCIFPPDFAMADGAMLHVKEYYPHIYERILEDFPEVLPFV